MSKIQSEAINKKVTEIVGLLSGMKIKDITETLLLVDGQIYGVFCSQQVLPDDLSDNPK